MKKLTLVVFVFAALALGMVGCSKSSSSPSTSATIKDTIYYSNWTTLNFTLEYADTTSFDSLFYEDITASKVTSTIISGGVVLSFIGIPGSGLNGASGTDTLAINISDLLGWSYGTTLSADLLPGNIELYGNHSSLEGVLYRYVVIPGSVLTTNSVLKGYTKEQLKKADFATISKALSQANLISNN